MARFLTIAKSSCAEVRCQLYLAQDIGLIPPEVAQPVLNQAVKVSALIGALRASRPTKLT